MGEALYDRIGLTYGAIRQADSRLAEPIWRALGGARSVVNVGAGTGSYEPPSLEVTAVEPSAVMIAQRPAGAAPAVQAAAEHLPFVDNSFDAALAIVTLHHWNDLTAGLAELTRVARRRVVLVTFDLAVQEELWIWRDYLPELVHSDTGMPSIARLLDELPAAIVESILIPNDCTDRMFASLWGRPEEYLDPRVRAATSVWHLLPQPVVERALDRLRDDLESGVWDERHGRLRTTPTLDVGLRLIRVELPG
jgi:SAM-dependent methyltransferase